MSPGRRTNRKNSRRCQRTILLYSFYFLSQRKIAGCNCMCFQSSAGCPQGCDRILCSRLDHSSRNPRQSWLFGLGIDWDRCESEVTIAFQACENRGLGASCGWFAADQLRGGQEKRVDLARPDGPFDSAQGRLRRPSPHGYCRSRRLRSANFYLFIHQLLVVLIGTRQFE